MNTYVFTYDQSLNITGKLPKNWKTELSKPDIEFNTNKFQLLSVDVYDIDKMTNDTIRRKVEIKFNTKYSYDTVWDKITDVIDGMGDCPDYCEPIGETEFSIELIS